MLTEAIAGNEHSIKRAMISLDYLINIYMGIKFYHLKVIIRYIMQ